ncbi:hypothetical protein [Pseudonocardia sp. TRM90224]|uniref:hypothetical protein n=1 Tax=Pseudonocardia sp. TRM90224 TaxID=2812678 RepID=UPI001E2F21A0|nr:hypothetical protein [Pseudonocardia sp. TRM90224]
MADSDFSYFRIDHAGSTVEVETDESAIVSATVRLKVDGRLVAESSTMLNTRLSGSTPAGEVTVKVAFGFFGGVTKCVLVLGRKELPMDRVDREGRKSREKDRDDDDGEFEEILDAII